jgi:DNA-binding transcriptional ArsR family regulator
MPAQLDATFDALGDATRRQVFARLRDGPISVGELAAGLPVSRPAVSQHLKVLLDAGLVSVSAAGRRRLYEADLDGLGPLRAWIESFWDDALARFKRHAEATAPVVDERTRHDRRRHDR